MLRRGIDIRYVVIASCLLLDVRQALPSWIPLRHTEFAIGLAWVQSGNVVLSPIGYVHTHQRLEEFNVVRHPQMQKLMRDHEILEARFLISQVLGKRNDARR